ncbi:Mbov_0399 family ICE element protein [Mycoplasma sp. 125]|uniref:Mbov_0399 family ICE element protein n=1 Tax=Mycoplasma sp. 125 TaxID=3447505 RepID=UPI003F6565D4
MKKRHKFLITFSALLGIGFVGWGIQAIKDVIKNKESNSLINWKEFQKMKYQPIKYHRFEEVPLELSKIETKTKGNIVINDVPFLPDREHSNFFDIVKQIANQNNTSPEELWNAIKAKLVYDSDWIEQEIVSRGHHEDHKITNRNFKKNPDKFRAIGHLTNLYNNERWFHDWIDAYLRYTLNKQFHDVKKFYIKEIRISGFSVSETIDEIYYKRINENIKSKEMYWIAKKGTITATIVYDYEDSNDKAYNYFKQKFMDAFKSQKTSDNKLILKKDYNAEAINAIPSQKLQNFKTNQEILNEWFSKTFNPNLYDGFSIRWEISKNNSKAFNILIENNTTKQEQYLYKNIEISWNNSDKAQLLELPKRLEIIPSKYVSFSAQSPNNPSGLITDQGVLVNDGKKGISKDKKTINLGTWIYHAPVDVSFNALKKENEALEINNIKIDVLEQKFKYTLYDQRANANDNSTIDINEGGAKEKEELKKNEYIIKVKVFNNINIDKEPKNTYIYKIIIDSKAQSQDYKWYAWNPDKIRSQKDRITQYLEDKDGNKKLDKNGNYIPNPKYDPLIDKKTGTKKELVWIDFSKLGFNITKDYFDNYLYKDFKQKYQINEADYPKDKMWNYYQNTMLPPLTQNLLHTTNGVIASYDKGTIAEASVVSKGAIKELLGETTQYIVYKLDDSQKKWIPNFLDTKTSGFSYFSTPGLYLFTSAAKQQVSSYKLILIDGRDDESVNNKLFSEIKGDLTFVNKLWNTTQGLFFLNYITKNHKVDKDSAKTLSYEEIVEYWKTYITFLATNQEPTIDIKPRFDFSIWDYKYANFEELKKAFKEKYKSNIQNIIKELGNFELSNYVGLINYEFDEATQGIKLRLFKSVADSRFNLNNQIWNYEFKFKDSSKNSQDNSQGQIQKDNGINNKDLIVLDWNTIKLKILAAESHSGTEFIQKVDNEIKTNGFKNIVNNPKQYSYLELGTPLLFYNNGTLKISVKLKDKYKNKYYINNPEFVGTFKFGYNDEFEIFAGFNAQKIYLYNEEKEAVIEEKITEMIKQQIAKYNAKLVLGTHYEIENLKELARDLAHNKTYDESSTYFPYKVIVRPRLPYHSYTKILFPVINLSKFNFDDIKFKKMEIDYDVDNLTPEKENKLLEEFKKKIIEQINKTFRASTKEIFYYTNNREDQRLFISGIENDQLKLLFSRNELVVKIRPSAKYLAIAKGESTLIVKNINKSADKPFDISKLNIADLKLNASKPDVIREEIIDYVKSQLSFINNLQYAKDYVINNIAPDKIFSAFRAKNAPKLLNVEVVGQNYRITNKKAFKAIKKALYNLNEYRWTNFTINVDVDNINSYYDKKKILDKIKAEIIANLNNQIRTNLKSTNYSIELGDFLVEPQLSEAILEILFYKRPLNLIINANNLDLDGSFNIQIKNIHPSANKPFPLSKIKISDLAIYRNKKLSEVQKIAKIKEVINNHINNNEQVKALNLKNKEDYIISMNVYINGGLKNQIYDYEDSKNEWILKSFIYNEKVKDGNTISTINDIEILLIAKKGNKSEIAQNSKTGFKIYGKNLAGEEIIGPKDKIIISPDKDIIKKPKNSDPKNKDDETILNPKDKILIGPDKEIIVVPKDNGTNKPDKDIILRPRNGNKNNPSDNIILNPKDEIIINEKGEILIKKSGENTLKPLDKLKVPSLRFKKIWLAWIIPLSLVLIGLLVFAGWAIYVRYGKKKIK